MDQALPFDREVDARGLNCPLPILRTKKALNDMTTGQVLRIMATDPSAVRDFEAFANESGGGASDVPEPANAALLIAGLGMMGFVAGRRKRN